MEFDFYDKTTGINCKSQFDYVIDASGGVLYVVNCAGGFVELYAEDNVGFRVVEDNKTKVVTHEDSTEEKLSHLEYLLKKYARIQMSAEGFVEEELRECINLINEINKGEQQ